VACVAAMMRVTKSSFGVATPLMIALLPLLRLGLVKSHVIDEESLKVLDD